MLNDKLFKKNRRKFSEKIKPGGLAIFHSNDQMPTNADGLMPFRQNNDLFYLSGIDQEDSCLIIFPDAKDQFLKEILFIKKTNETIMVWEGHKLTIKEAQKKSGIKTVLWLDDYDRVLNDLMTEVNTLYLSTNEHPRAKVIVESLSLIHI